MPTLGVTELMIVGAIVALLFGGSKLPGIGRGLGSMISEFRTAVKGEPKPQVASPTETEPEQSQQA